ncbi:uncharacterized protein LOC144954293, partial [Lampetra fluviatilis]
MEQVRCSQHGSLCILKTGSREGKSRGKSFYICSDRTQPCGYTQPSGLPPSHCLCHPDVMVELQEIHNSRLLYRCTRGKEEKRSWCGSVPWKDPTLVRPPARPLTRPTERNPFRVKPEEDDGKRAAAGDCGKLADPKGDDVTKPSASRQIAADPKGGVNDVTKPSASRQIATDPKGDDVTKPSASRQIATDPKGDDVTKPSASRQIAAVPKGDDVTKPSASRQIAAVPKGDDVTKPSASRQIATDPKGDDVTKPSASRQIATDPKGVNDVTKPSASRQIAADPKGVNDVTKPSASRQIAAVPNGDDVTKPSASRQIATDPRGINDVTKPSASRQITADPKGVNDVTKLSVSRQIAAVPNGDDVTKPSASRQIATDPRGINDVTKPSASRQITADPKGVNDVTKPSASRQITADPKGVNDVTKPSASRQIAAVPNGDDVTKPSASRQIAADPKGVNDVTKLSVSRQIAATPRTTQRPLTSFAGFAPRATPQQQQQQPPQQQQQQPPQQQQQQPPQQQQPSQQQQHRQAAIDRNCVVSEVQRKMMTLRVVDVAALPDGGERLRQQLEELQRQLRHMDITGAPPPPPAQEPRCEVYRPGPTNHVAPPTSHDTSHDPARPIAATAKDPILGTYGVPRAEVATYDLISRLSQSLDGCPPPWQRAPDPPGLKVTLLPHQAHALAWMQWREEQEPAGGILADDMGLGKTLTVIALLMSRPGAKAAPTEAATTTTNTTNTTTSTTTNTTTTSTTNTTTTPTTWLSKHDDDDTPLPAGGTLVVCPASLLHHWRQEIELRTTPGRLTVCVHHGEARERSPHRLCRYSVVLTTYNLVAREVGDGGQRSGGQRSRPQRGATLGRVNWARLVLDEAHNVKNPK